jgi:hypothetical protein
MGLGRLNSREDIEHGPFLNWCPDRGSIRIEGSFENGTEVGTRKGSRVNKTIDEVLSFNNGVLDSRILSHADFEQLWPHQRKEVHNALEGRSQGPSMDR